MISDACNTSLPDPPHAKLSSLLKVAIVWIEKISMQLVINACIYSCAYNNNFIWQAANSIQESSCTMHACIIASYIAM